MQPFTLNLINIDTMESAVLTVWTDDFGAAYRKMEAMLGTQWIPSACREHPGTKLIPPVRGAFEQEVRACQECQPVLETESFCPKHDVIAAFLVRSWLVL